MPAPFAHLSRSAKFSIPPRPPDQLRRPRLLDFLHNHIHRRLLLISAAAGYGKTTLLADFAHDTDYAVVWYRLDETDRDLTALTTALTAAIQNAFPAFETTASQMPSPEAVAATFNRELSLSVNDYFVLAFDDFHLVEESEAVRRFFDALVADLPEQAHIILVGRTIPPLHLARLAARQQVAGLSEEHLRFDAQEVQALLELRRHAVSLAEAEQMAAKTEGWITGILLTSHALWDGLIANWVKARPITGPLYDYLAAEVLGQQPPTLRRFLLEAAVLPEMEPAVCDAVLGRADSADLLEQAEARRLFITSVGDEQRSYQFHHLFHEFLLDQLSAQDPARLQTVRVAAADWYAANGLPEAAVTFYGLAGQLARAARLVDENARALFVAGRFATLRQWATQLASLAHDLPRLHLYLAKVDTDAGQLEHAEANLRVAADGFARQGHAAGQVEVNLQLSWVRNREGQFETALNLARTAQAQARAGGWRMTEALAWRGMGVCYLALRQLAEAELALQTSTHLFPTADSHYDVALAYNDLALVFRIQGKAAQAAQAQQKALRVWRERALAWPLGVALNNVGLDLHMLGQYDAALRTYREALEWAWRAGHVQAEALILAGQGDVLTDLADSEAASQLYREAMAKAEEVNDTALSAYLCRAMARLDYFAGQWVSAQEWLRRAAMVAPQKQALTPLANTEALRGMILVEMGQRAEGRRVLEAVCAELEQSGGLVDLAQTVFFRACAEYREGDVSASATSLARAFELAERIGYDQMLLSEARAARDLLEAAAAWPAVGARASNLLQRARALPGLRAKLQQSGALPEIAQASLPDQIVLHVQALGRGRVVLGAAETSRAAWESQRTRELFFYLIDQAPVPRDAVLQLFWPDKPTARASANLRQTLYRMRRAVGHEVVVITEAQECRLIADMQVDYDVVRFEAEARAALALPIGDGRRLGGLAAAAARYTGEYLADLPVDWALARRRALSDLHTHVLRTYAGELMNLTRYAEARNILSRALEEEPLDDGLHEQMLLCLNGQGRRHEVVEHYRRYREALRLNLGLDPPPRIMALYARLIE